MYAPPLLSTPAQAPAVSLARPNGFASDRGPAIGEAATNDLPSAVRTGVQSPGQPLESGTQDVMESRFGHDFSAIRVHTDETAAASAQAVQARAYTVGNHIVFGRGETEDRTASDDRLLAHELAHTVQQSRGGEAGTEARDHEALERDAQSAAENIGGGAGPIEVSGAAPVQLARQPLSEDVFVREEEPLTLRGSVSSKALQPDGVDRELATMSAWLKKHSDDPRADHVAAERDRLELEKFSDEQTAHAARMAEGVKKYGRLVSQSGRGFEIGDSSFNRWMERPNHQLGFDEPGFSPEEVAEIAKVYHAKIMAATEPSPEKKAEYAKMPKPTFEQTYAETLEDGRVAYGVTKENLFKERNLAIGNVYQQKIEGVRSGGIHSLGGRVLGAMTAWALGKDVQAGGEIGAATFGVLGSASPMLVRGGVPTSSNQTSPLGGPRLRPEAAKISPSQPQEPVPAPDAGLAPKPSAPAAAPSRSPQSAVPYAPGSPLGRTQPNMAFEPTEPGTAPPRRDTQGTLPPPGGGGGGGGGRRRPRDTIVSSPPPMPLRPPPPRPVIPWFPRNNGVPMGPQEVQQVMKIDPSRIVWSVNPGHNAFEWGLVSQKGAGLPPLAYTTNGNIRVDYYRWKAMGLPEPQQR